MSLSSRITNLKARLTAAKPYLIGGALGAVATLIIEFNAGWVVTAGTHHQAVAQTRTDAIATVCARQASAHWVAEGHELSALKGWDNDERDALAKRFASGVQDVSADEIANLCGRKLRTA